MKEIETCALCGIEEKGLYSMRCVRVANDGHLWDGYYKPQLSPEEKWLLKDNKEHYICIKRQDCKERRLK